MLFSRVEEFNIFKNGDSIGISLDYWNQDELRLSLRDAYIFFKKQ